MEIVTSWVVERGLLSKTGRSARLMCVMVGALYPVYATLKAMEAERRAAFDERRAETAQPLEPPPPSGRGGGGDGAAAVVPGTHKWLTYWCAYGCFNVGEMFTDRLIWWLPYYYTVKLLVLLWMVLPTFEGSQALYLRVLRPFFRRNHIVLDPWVEKAEKTVASAVEDTIEQAERGAQIATQLLGQDDSRTAKWLHERFHSIMGGFGEGAATSA